MTRVTDPSSGHARFGHDPKKNLGHDPKNKLGHDRDPGPVKVPEY